MIEVNIKQYREPFFTALARSLDKHDIDLRVVYSDPSPLEVSKGDNVDLSPPLGHKVSRAFFFSERALWQNIPYGLVRQADLVVIIQANGYLSNYPLLLARLIGWRRLAYFGHGYNHKGRRDTLRERVKRWLAPRVDWWFAYTERTAQHLTEVGMRPERITVFQNTIDTRAFADMVQRITEAEVDALRSLLKIAPKDRVVLYCGSLYPEKELPFLLKAADQLRARLLSFQLIVIGAGPESRRLQSAASVRPWLHYMGPCFGSDKASYFRISDAVLNPGLVGLGILDCFAAGRPIITCDLPNHGPEIAYLEDDVNGLMCPFEAAAYVDTVCEVLRNPDRLRRLQAGARASAGRYTLENTIARISEGILQFFECNGGTRPMDEVKKTLRSESNS